MHRGACKYACGRTNEPTNEPGFSLGWNWICAIPNSLSARQTNVFAFYSGSFAGAAPSRKKDDSIWRNNQRKLAWSFRGDRAALFCPPSPYPLAACNLTGTLRCTYVRIRPLNPRTWCIRLTTHSGSQNVSLELSTAQPRTFRGDTELPRCDELFR